MRTLLVLLVCACKQEAPAPGLPPEDEALVEGVVTGIKHDCDVAHASAIHIAKIRTDTASLVGHLGLLVSDALGIAATGHQHATKIVTGDEASAGAKALITEAGATAAPFTACLDALTANRKTTHELCDQADAIFAKLIQSKRTLVSELDPAGLDAHVYKTIETTAKIAEDAFDKIHETAAARPDYCP